MKDILFLYLVILLVFYSFTQPSFIVSRGLVTSKMAKANVTNLSFCIEGGNQLQLYSYLSQIYRSTLWRVLSLPHYNRASYPSEMPDGSLLIFKRGGSKTLIIVVNGPSPFEFFLHWNLQGQSHINSMPCEGSKWFFLIKDNFIMFIPQKDKELNMNKHQTK